MAPTICAARHACVLLLLEFPMKRYWLLFSQTTTVLLAAYFVVATLKPQWLGHSASTVDGAVAMLEAAPLQPGEIPPGSYRLAAQKASAAVVSINTS